MRFKDRKEAGQKLADALSKYKDTDAVVYALPRGGVVLGGEIARALNIPLDLVITRKIGHPMQPEYAVCVVSESGETLCNEDEKSRLEKDWLDNAVKEEQAEARRRREVYLKGKSSISPKGKTAIIVDDGIATGLTIELAIKEIKKGDPKKVVIAVPVIPPDTAEKFRQQGELVALHVPTLYLGAVGSYYDDFPQVEDDEVIEIMGEYTSIGVDK